MNYELRNAYLTGTPKANGDGTATYTIVVEPKVTGDVYNFGKPTITTFTAPESDTVDQIKALIQSTAVAYVAATYPNT